MKHFWLSIERRKGYLSTSVPPSLSIVRRMYSPLVSSSAVVLTHSSIQFDFDSLSFLNILVTSMTLPIMKNEDKV